MCSPDLLVCLLLIALCLGFFWPVLFGNVLLPADGLYLLDPVFAAQRPSGVHTPVNALLVPDLVGVHYPWRAYASRSLRAGIVPLWNPYSACGMPFLANNQSAVLSPVNLLLNALFSPPRAQTLFALLTLLAACLFTYGLVRSLGGAPVGGLLAGLTFGFGGFVLTWLGYPLAAAAALLPALLWATHALVHRPTLGRAVPVAVIIGAEFLAGHVSTSVQMLAFWALFVGYEAAAHQRAALRRVLLLAGLALVLGVALGAPQLLPTGELFRLSTIGGRGRSRWAMDSAAKSLEKGILGDTWFLRTLGPSEAGLLFAPEIRGNPAFGDYRPLANYGNYAERASYVGALALIALAAGGLALRTAGHRRFFTVTAWIVFAILLHMPVFNLVIYLPLLRLAAPQRLRFVFTLCAAVALGLAATEWTRAPRDGKQRGRGGLLVTGGAVTVLCAAGAALAWSHAASAFARLGPADVALRALKVLTPPAAAVTVLGLLLRGKRGLATGLVMVAVADLFIFAARWQPTARPAHVLPPVAEVQHIGGARIAGPPTLLRPDLSVAYGLHDTRVYDPLIIRRYAALAEGLRGAASGAAPQLVFGSGQRSFAFERLTSVAYVWRAGGSGAPTLERTNAGLPRAYVAGRVRSVSAKEALTAITSGLDPEGVTLIEIGNSSSGNGPVRRAAITVDDSDRVAVQACGPGWLVLTDSYYPGWRVTVNGRPSAVVPANYAFRAVAIPEGESKIVFSYEPASYRLGLFASLLSLATLLTIAGAGSAFLRPQE